MFKHLTDQRIMKIDNPHLNEDKFKGRLHKYFKRGYTFVTDDTKYLHVNGVIPSSKIDAFLLKQYESILSKTQDNMKLNSGVQLVSNPIQFIKSISKEIDQKPNASPVQFVSNMKRLSLALSLCEQETRIGHPFKTAFTEIFNKVFEPFFQTEQTCNQHIKELIHQYFIENVMRLRDIRWLLNMMCESSLFEFTQSDYEKAVLSHVARDNLYLIKRMIAQNETSNKRSKTLDIRIAILNEPEPHEQMDMDTLMTFTGNDTVQSKF